MHSSVGCFGTEEKSIKGQLFMDDKNHSSPNDNIIGEKSQEVFFGLHHFKFICDQTDFCKLPKEFLAFYVILLSFIKQDYNDMNPIKISQAAIAEQGGLHPRTVKRWIAQIRLDQNRSLNVDKKWKGCSKFIQVQEQSNNADKYTFHFMRFNRHELKLIKIKPKKQISLPSKFYTNENLKLATDPLQQMSPQGGQTLSKRVTPMSPALSSNNISKQLRGEKKEAAAYITKDTRIQEALSHFHFKYDSELLDKCLTISKSDDSVNYVVNLIYTATMKSGIKNRSGFLHKSLVDFTNGLKWDVSVGENYLSQSNKKQEKIESLNVQTEKETQKEKKLEQGRKFKKNVVEKYEGLYPEKFAELKIKADLKAKEVSQGSKGIHERFARNALVKLVFEAIKIPLPD